MVTFSVFNSLSESEKQVSGHYVERTQANHFVETEIKHTCFLEAGAA